MRIKILRTFSLIVFLNFSLDFAGHQFYAIIPEKLRIISHHFKLLRLGRLFKVGQVRRTQDLIDIQQDFNPALTLGHTQDIFSI